MSLNPRRSAALFILTCAAAVWAAEPRAGLLHSAPAQARPNEALQVDGSLIGSATFDKVVVKYRGPGQDYLDAKMELQYGDLYRGFIPAGRMVPPGVEYYVEGIGKGGERVPLFMTASRPARVIVLPDDGADNSTSVVISDTSEAPSSKKGKKGKKGRQEKPERVKEVKEVEKPTASDEIAAFDEPAETPKSDKRTEQRAYLDKPEKETPPEPEAKPPPRERPPPEPRREEVRTTGKPTSVPPPATEAPREETPRLSPMEEDVAVHTARFSPGVVASLDSSATKDPQVWLTVTAEQMKAMGARHVYEVLDMVPGLAVSRDVQGFWRVAVRGFRSDAEVLFLYDGHEMNNFYDGRALVQLPVDNLARIEVLRGPGPATFATTDYLAIVNIVPNREVGLHVGLTAGAYGVPTAPATNPQAPPPPGQNLDQRGAIEGHVNGAALFGALKLFIDGDVNKQNGYYKPVVADGLRLSTPAGYTDDHRVLINVGAGLEYSKASFGTFGARARFLREDRAALVGQYDAVGPGSRLQWNAITADVDFKKRLSDLATLSLAVFFDQQSTDRLFRQTPANFVAQNGVSFPEGLTENQQVGARRFGLKGGFDFRLPFNNLLTVGLQTQYAMVSNYAYLVNFSGIGNDQYAGPTLSPAADAVSPLDAGGGAAARRLTVSLVAQDTWRPIEWFTIQAGVRFDLNQLPTGDRLGQVSGSTFAPALSPRLAVVIAPLPYLSFKGRYGRGYRLPTVQEYAEQIPNSSANQGRFEGNASLTPAYSDALEGSLEYVHGLGDVRARARGGIFYQRLTNPIASVDPTGNIVPVRNRPDGAQSYGVEFEGRLELWTRGAAFVNVSWVRAEDTGTVATARLLTDTPQLRANAGVTVPLGPYFAFDAFARVHSERRNDSRSVLELVRRYRFAPYALVGGQLRTEILFDHLELGFLVQNAFDVDYADDVPRPDRITGGVPREGISAWATVRFHL